MTVLSFIENSWNDKMGINFFIEHFIEKKLRYIIFFAPKENLKENKSFHKASI